ncbi:MAG: hypothetical protein IKP60_02220 [Treponema sp.]|nr:hypothetical protein [Treponema sp.]
MNLQKRRNSCSSIPCCEEQGTNEGQKVHFVDSTPVEVCKNSKISRHRVARGYASRGKSTKGWFFGFKLHGVCTEDLAALAVGGVFMHNATRKNMKRLISKEQFDAIEKRNIIETVWSPQGEFLPCVYQGPKRHGHVPAFLLQHCSFFAFALTLRF